jgi:CDP-paratose 2-epimerase
VTAGQVYNIGGGADNALSVWVEFKESLASILGRRVEAADYCDWRPGDQPIYVSDTSKAARDFGWRPHVGMEEGIARLCNWIETNKELIQQEVL